MEIPSTAGTNTDESGTDPTDEGPPLHDDRLTLAGLFAESWTGFSRAVEQQLQDDHDLPLQWFVLLLRISRSPDRRLRLSDLAAQTGMSPSGLTRALDRLEQAGLAERMACPDDRRGAFATITDLGLARLVPAVEDHLRHLDATLLQALSPEEQTVLARLLRRVRDRVNPAASRPPEPIASPRGKSDLVPDRAP